MIRNGLYHITVEMLNGVQGGNQGVMVVCDGTLRDAPAESDGIALAGKQSIRFKSKLRLLIAD
jgi:hypothetical protein